MLFYVSSSLIIRIVHNFTSTLKGEKGKIKISVIKDK